MNRCLIVLLSLLLLSSCSSKIITSCPPYPKAGKEAGKELAALCLDKDRKTLPQCKHIEEWQSRLKKHKEALEVGNGGR